MQYHPIIFRSLLIMSSCSHAGASLAADVLMRASYVSTVFQIEGVKDDIVQKGFSPGIGLQSDQNFGFSVAAWYQPTILIDEQEMVRHSYFGMAEWVLYGQSRHLSHSYDNVHITFTGDWAVYLPLQASYNIYEMTLADRPGKLTGSATNIQTGLGYRKRISPANSLSVELTRAVLGIAAGEGKVKTEEMTFSLVFRNDLEDFGKMFSLFH
jgi:hypothetical protein